MKDLSNEELINKFRAMCSLFIIYGKFQKDPDFNEANKISDKLLSHLAAGEAAVKKVAELENDKRELVETLDTILQICHDYPLSCRARVIEKAENTIAKHKEAL